MLDQILQKLFIESKMLSGCYNYIINSIIMTHKELSRKTVPPLRVM